MSIFNKIGSNIKKNVKSSELKDTSSKWLYGVLGLFAYLTVPAVVKRMTGWDTSGYKGMAIGSASAIFIGFASDKKEIAIGGLTGVASHLLYNHVNEPFANLVGEQFFPFDRIALEKSSVPTGAIDPILKETLSDSINEELPPSLRRNDDGTLKIVKFPDGSQVNIPTEEINNPVSDLTNDLQEVTKSTNTLELKEVLSDELELDKSISEKKIIGYVSPFYSNGSFVSRIAI